MAASETTKVAPLGMAGSSAEPGLSAGAASGDTVGGGTSFSSRVRSEPVLGSNTLSPDEMMLLSATCSQCSLHCSMPICLLCPSKSHLIRALIDGQHVRVFDRHCSAKQKLRSAHAGSLCDTQAKGADAGRNTN